MPAVVIGKRLIDCSTAIRPEQIETRFRIGNQPSVGPPPKPRDDRVTLAIGEVHKEPIRIARFTLPLRSIRCKGETQESALSTATKVIAKIEKRLVENLVAMHDAD